jgi:hypothetical protein
MGCNYTDKAGKLIRTVCRAFTEDGVPMIAYVNIATGGYASDIYLDTEENFKSRFNL